ncbi:MAG TPA: hypothetical protein VEO01_12020 [Pseudonocardiaceae bacterium]|nr:hypothetical protein [Pseudonocardiaceae bacterium]
MNNSHLISLGTAAKTGYPVRDTPALNLDHTAGGAEADRTCTWPPATQRQSLCPRRRQTGPSGGATAEGDSTARTCPPAIATAQRTTAAGTSALIMGYRRRDS